MVESHLMDLVALSREPSRPVRVMRVITQLSRGGVEAKLAELLPLLGQRGFEVSVCCIKEAGSLAHRFAEAGIPIHVFPVRSRLHPIDLVRLARFIGRQWIDVVHTHMHAANVTGTLAARLASVPVIVANVHNVGKFQSRRQVVQDRLLARYRDGTVCVSEQVKDDYLKATGLSDEKAAVIYNGVDTAKFRPVWQPVGAPLAAPCFNLSNAHRAGQAPLLHDPAVLPVRRELGIGEDERVLISVGRLIPQKSPELLISAFKIVHESHPKTRLLVLGSGELRCDLEALAAKLALSSSMIFAGFREDVAECLAASDVFVSSSVKEGFSNALLEALASGLPAVVTDVGGNREALRDGQEGFLCKPRPQELAERVVRILCDSELCERMSKSARERAMEFSLDRMAEQTAAYYRSLLAQKRGRTADE
ncbi:MAG: glycosyltransferase [Candidatus Coatesbacteria bacterium]|nr:glycosyltransferase [Candidatus Coatesbacteria bacterium]